MLETLAPDYTHQVLPESLNMPKRSRAEFAAHAAGITSIFTEFAMEPQSVYEDAKANTVLAHCRMVGQLARGLGPWVNSCVIFMKFNEDGTLITEWVEFVDSARAGLLRQKLMGAMDKNMDMKKGGPRGGFLPESGYLALLAGVAVVATVGFRLNWLKVNF